MKKKKKVASKKVIKKDSKKKNTNPKKDIQYNRQPQMWISGVPGSFRYMF